MNKNVIEKIAKKIKGKKFIFNRYVRIFFDSGHPIYKQIPMVRKYGYHVDFGMYGFIISWLGREMHFSIGYDKYKRYIY